MELLSQEATLDSSSLFLLLFVRHGEKEIDSPIDPGLTSEGANQARRTGEYLRKQLEYNQINEIVIESSPYLRTMQTAAHIIKEVFKEQGEARATINVNYNVQELAGDKTFQRNPIPELHFSKMSKEEFEITHLEGVAFLNQGVPLNLYPENPLACRNRLEQSVKSSLRNFQNEQSEKKRVAKIIVTHQFLVKNFRSAFTGEILIRTRGNPQDMNCGFCSISGGQIWQNQMQLVFDCFEGHIFDQGPKEMADSSVDSSLSAYTHSEETKRDKSKHHYKKKVCFFWLNGTCKFTESECKFLHQVEEKKPDNQKECPYYLKGFCKRFAGGAKDKICPYQHTKKLICKNWMAGFCRNGPTCTRQHPKQIAQDGRDSIPAIHSFCFRCGQQGHQPKYCMEDQITQEEVERIKKKVFM